MQASTDDSQSERVDRSLPHPPIQSSQSYEAAITTDNETNPIETHRALLD
jgi:hypothetical protein